MRLFDCYGYCCCRASCQCIFPDALREARSDAAAGSSLPSSQCRTPSTSSPITATPRRRRTAEASTLRTTSPLTRPWLPWHPTPSPMSPRKRVSWRWQRQSSSPSSGRLKISSFNQNEIALPSSDVITYIFSEMFEPYLWHRLLHAEHA